MDDKTEAAKTEVWDNRTQSTIRLPRELMVRLALFLAQETGQLRGRNALIIHVLDEWLREKGY